MNKITIISSEKNWLESAAVDQLTQIAALPGIEKIVGLPDLHPGKTPVGAAFITENIIYPHLIGNDIGCGVSLFMTAIEKKKMKLDRWERKLEELEELSQIDMSEGNDHDFSDFQFHASLGTIGGGNHFAEIQEVATILDTAEFEKLGLSKNHIMLLVHSGSRGYGQAILDEFIHDHQAQNGLAKNTEVAKQYLIKHDAAVNWAMLNRELIAYRLLKALQMQTDTTKIIDSVHNSITAKVVGEKNLYVHRKGAAPGDSGAIAIPGSRGTLTYLVIPGEDTAIAGYSLAHGAGRKWERSMCKGRLENKYTKETIKQTKFKGKVICSNNKLLFEEAPEAYKNIDIIIQDLVDAGLVKVIATLKPVLTYKG